MIQIIKVDFDLVGPDDGVVVGFRVGLLGEQFLFVAVFDAGWTSDARAQLQQASVVAFELVGIARHVGARSHKAHLPNQNVD